MKKRYLRTTSLTTFLLAFSSGSIIVSEAHAACTSPAAVAGTMEYFSGEQVFKVCDGTTWNDVGGGAGGSGNCAAQNNISFNLSSCSGIGSGNFDCPSINHFSVGACSSDTSGYGDASILCVDGTRIQLNPIPTTACKVLCTYYNSRGLLADRVLAGDLAYAEIVAPQIGRAYRAWANPLIAYLKKHEGGWADRLMLMLVKSWANEMAFRTGYADKGSLVGRILSVIGEPIHYAVGAFLPKDQYEHYIGMRRDYKALSSILEGRAGSSAI